MSAYADSALAELFGKPGEGIHTHVGGVAVMDVALTAGAAVLIGKATNKPIPVVFLGLIAVGVVAHWYFKVPTTLNKKLGLVRPDETDQ